MSWFTPLAGLKKKICRYLLQRYLGQFLEEKLNLEQLNVDLYNGTGSVSNVALNCEALNELFESQGWGIEVTGGHIGTVTVTVPWNALMTDDSNIEVTKLFISLKPVPRQTDGTSMFESMWSSMSSSMQLAKECLENEGDDDIQINTQSATIEGLEKFAQTIDSVLNRIKAKLIDTEIRLEYVLPNSDRGIAILIKVNRLDYQNEAGSDPPDSENITTNLDEEQDDQKTHLISSYATHHISIEGITFYTEEFRVVNIAQQVPKTDSLICSEQFYSTISQLPETEQHLISENLKLIDTSDIQLSSDIDGDSNKNENIIEIYSSKSIITGKLEGKQEIRIKMKQSENIYGPKVHLEMQFGLLSLFMSPRQLHLIIKFFDIFFNDQQQKLQHNQQKLNTDAELRRKRRNELQKMQKRYSSMSGIITSGINDIGGGGGGGYWADPSDELKTHSQIPKLFNTNIPTTLDYCESMSSSMTSSSTATNSTRFRHKINNTETSGDISHFNLRIANVIIVLLHEDILLENSILNNDPLSKESTSKLIELSEEFFSEINQTINCQKNHLKLNLTPIIVEGEQQRNNNIIILRLTTSITKIEFDEILQNISTPIIKFKREELCSGGLHKRPEFTLTLKTSNSTNGKSLSSKKSSNTKMNFRLKLESCVIELDISLYDRLNFIIGPSPFNTNSLLDFNNATDTTTPSPTNAASASATNRHGEPLTELNVEAPSLDIRLRFPIVDTRPLHDPDRIPWWKQNIRPDYLLFNFHQFRLNYSFNSIEIAANEIDIFYCENDNSPKIHVGKTNLVSKKCVGMNESSIEYPKISITFPSDKSLKTLLKCNIDDSDSGETSGESCALFSKRPKEFLPFSSKRVCRQSDTPHIKTDIDDSETILLPGDAIEMKKFCERSMRTSKLQFKVSLPIASVQINSKHLYEILYNRLNTDLLMWEPVAPNLISKIDKIQTPPILLEQSLMNCGMMDSMYIPSSTISSPIKKQKHPYDNDESSIESSDISEDDNDTSDESNGGDNDSSSDHNLFYSAYDKKQQQRLKKNNQLSNNNSSLLLSACSFDLNIDQCLLTLYAPVRDNENRILPGQLGEFILKINNFNLFSVNGFNGNKNLAYLCMQLQSGEIYHCGLISNPDYNSPLRLLNKINDDMPSHVQATLYPTSENSVLGCGNNNNDKDKQKREMLSFAVEIKKIPDQRIKRLRITTSLRNATLKHNPAITQHTWLNQIIDMFDVMDYPIEGYKPYSIVTEMQLHLWDCAIDYRPLQFGYRAIAEIGSLMISSNLTTTTTGCTLRFIAEECALSLAPYDFKMYQDKPKNKIIILPSKELICVLDLGLLDISLRINEKASEMFPKFDLRSSIQDMHIRTCSDSGRALAHLIAYLASDGDLSNSNEEESQHDVENESNLFVVEKVKQFGPEITEKQQERVNTLMAEALQETVNIIPESDDDEFKNDRGVEVFFFPDETKQLKKLKEEKDNINRTNDDFDELKQETMSISDDSSTIKPSTIIEEKLSSTKHDCNSIKSDPDEWNFDINRENDNESENNELRDLLNFETSVMCKSYNLHEEAVEALPQIRQELGEVNYNLSPKKSGNDKQSRKNSFSVEDDFYFIPDEDKVYMSKCGKEVEITNDPLRIVDNHFSLPMGKPDLLKAPENFPMAVMRYTLCEMTLTWHLYGGNDFPTNNDNKEKSDHEEIRQSLKPMSDAYKVGVSYSKSQQSVQFGNKKPLTKLSWKTQGGCNRNHDVLIEIQFTKVKLSHEIYPTYTTQASRQVVVISELEIRDRLQTSEINKFLYHPSPRHLSNKSSQHMIVIKALHVRPNPILQTQECSLRISLLPLRLNIDQDSLLFLVQFFNELSSTGLINDDDNVTENKRTTQQQSQPPVMMVDDLPEAVQDLQARKMVSTNLNLLMEDDQITKDKSPPQIENESVVQDSSTNNLPIYFKEVVFSPEVLIRLDYHGRRIEMSRGPIAGLLMGLGQLQCSEIRLKKICHRHGILGVDRLLNFLLQEWLQDIKKNQLPTILSGVGPMYTFVQLFQGIRDLFWLPIEQYQKDGRIVRGLQLGAQSFTARTALAALEITARIIQLLQITAETAFDMVSPGPSVRRGRHNRRGKRKRPHRPQDIREGVANAYQIVKEGINETANTLIETTAIEHDQKGYTGAVGAVFRQIPPIALRPVVLATQATTNVLGGVRNQLIPDARFEAKEKWKEDTD